MMRRIILAATLASLFAGCLNLLTSTEILQFDVIQDGQPATPGQPIALTVGNYHEATVELDGEDLFEEHKDEIHRVERLAVEAVTDNASTSTTTASIYISTAAGLTDPSNEAILILENLEIPGGQSEIDYDTSEPRVRNLEEIRDIVASGVFSLYTVADGPADLTFIELKLVITLSVGL